MPNFFIHIWRYAAAAAAGTVLYLSWALSRKTKQLEDTREHAKWHEANTQRLKEHNERQQAGQKARAETRRQTEDEQHVAEAHKQAGTRPEYFGDSRVRDRQNRDR